MTTGVRYLASQLGMSLPFQKLQENLLLWFYTAFVHRLGSPQRHSDQVPLQGVQHEKTPGRGRNCLAGSAEG